MIVNADSAQIYLICKCLARRQLQGSKAGPITGFSAFWTALFPAPLLNGRNGVEGNCVKFMRRDELPILVGGTGLYLRTLIEGIAPVPRDRSGSPPQGPQAPVEVKTRQPRDDLILMPPLGSNPPKLPDCPCARSISIDRPHQQPNGKAARGRDAGKVYLRPIVLLPPRKWLYERCDERFSHMVEQARSKKWRCSLIER